MPVPVPLLRIIERARGGRTVGAIVVTKRGNQQTRNGAYVWVKTLAKRAGLPENVHPHSLRHGAVSALVDAGVPMHEAQEFAGHADIRTTAHYYHRPLTLDQHGAHVTARVFAGAAA
ncbi:tyrosine-type recombinase/integrase [Microbacterium luteum]|uniref:tyrosine-type recombinase/integrase n=1 Tax=Microbacterium luteum TaxID=2782167 RepID=UPI001889487D|nr:tyrosine-type recombinase/integrase [Microbacterium luteum]